MDLYSEHPFWPINDGLIRNYPRLDADVTCDVAIIGAGITGALVARHLVDAGFDIVLLDRRDVAWGSTAASTALLQYEIDVSLADLSKMRSADVAQRAYLASRDALGRLESLAAGRAGFTRKKSLYLASKPRDRDTLREELELRRAIGIRVDWLEEEDIAQRFPFRRPAAILSHDAAQVDAYAFAHVLLDDATHGGARVFDRTAVEKIDATDNGVTLHTDRKCTVRARHLVFASGYETEQYLDKPVAKLVSTFALATEPLDDMGRWGEDECVIWEHAHPYLYLRTTTDRRIIVGGEDEDFRDPGHRDRLLPKKTKTLAGKLGELFPDLSFDVAFAWAGTFGETEDGLAYVGAHRDWPSSYFALGYGGNGITFSLLAAEIIRDELIGRHNENADLFRFDR
jgi:glycine/D-amino acid oxidase-like deaminating enzyme